MFLSFIVPVYNAQSYLPDCLDSLLHQDVPHSDYEIICVNDGSKDGSLAVLKTYQETFSNIRIIDKENGGVTTARNAGLAAAKGEYIWFVDSDDFIKENVLLQLRTAAQSGDYDRLIIGCYIFEDGLSEEEKELSRKKELPLNGPWYDSIVVRSLFRRSYLEKHELTFRYPDITHGEDGLFMYEAVIPGMVSFEIEEAIYFYRTHSGSAETSVSLENLKKKFRSYTRITQIHLDYYRNKGQKNEFTANKLMNFLWFSLHTAASMPVRESIAARKELKQLGLYPFQWLPECNTTQSFMTEKTGFVGKCYDKICMNLHRPWGFWSMFLIQQLLRLKRKLLK